MLSLSVHPGLWLLFPSWRTPIQCSPGESPVLPRGPNQISLAPHSLAGKPSRKGSLLLPGTTQLHVLFCFHAFYKLPCHVVSLGQFGTGSHLLSRPDSVNLFQRHHLELGHGGRIYARGAGKCYSQVLFPCGEQIVKHLPAHPG